MISKHKLSLLFILVFTGLAGVCVGQSTTEIENDLYKVKLQSDGSAVIVLKKTSAAQIFSPLFTVLYRDDTPVVKTPVDNSLGYRANVWNLPPSKTWSANYFEAGNSVLMKASGGTIKQNKLIWKFSPHPRFDLSAELLLPAGKEDPKIRFELKAKEEGFYSVGYSGAPEIKQSGFDEIWQPFIWQEKRFPYKSFLSTENMCSLPSVLVNTNKHTIGVIADPSEVPFRFATLKNSRFGVMLRNQAGNAQPMIFSPVLGLANSKFKKSDVYSFNFRLIFRNEPVFNTYQYMAQHIFGFHDVRKNATCSLNETLENMVRFAMDDRFGGWVAEYKGSDYTSDVPNTVKNVSALHPLSLAILTDDEQIYRHRALPMIEYLMSREKYLFALDTIAKVQSPSRSMKGPAANVSELAALYDISKKRSTVFKDYAVSLFGKSRVLNLEKVTSGSTWQNSLALYRMGSGKEYLDRAKAGADEYIETRINKLQTDFSDVQIESGERFPTSWTPKWVDLIELYEETNDEKYLDAAVKGARLFVNFVWLQPQIPQRNITINKGDTVGAYAYQNRFNKEIKPMQVAEQSVPAWRLSQVGLVPESTTTYEINRALFLAHFAPYMLRLAYYTNDGFLKDIARSAIVGRYANYPGYAINGEYTTINQRPDYVYRELWDITYNTIYYNHVWPQIALVTDYLISDAITASRKHINFPDQYAQGYAYLQSKVYGDRTGEFYGDKNVQPWLPANLLKTGTIQANYIAGYGNNKLYLAFMNQSDQKQDLHIRLNPDVVPFSGDVTYKVKVWYNNVPAKETTMVNGIINLPLSSRGITALSVDGIKVKPRFQDEVFAPSKPLSEKSYLTKETPLGKVTGMVISMGKDFTSSYIWMEASERDLKSAKLSYKENDKWQEVNDTNYPFEFSIALPASGKAFEYKIEGVNLKGEKSTTEVMTLVL
ncbi:MAG: hypothetical protein K0S09_1456 [Sphingobacteriaceae bacterium]|jgi:hypothetical protein|nr:hypothetical protein [Sphingobacteriaceae bacterium]